MPKMQSRMFQGVVQSPGNAVDTAVSRPQPLRFQISHS
jgi:hypothetical protein